jgi:hypothetical protein
LLALMDFMRLSSTKAAHVTVAWCRVQEIRVSRSFFARYGAPLGSWRKEIPPFVAVVYN